MRCIIFGLLTGLVVSAQPSPKITGVVNGASFGTRLSPGTLASLFGSNLATAASSAKSTPLPTELMGIQVLVKGSSTTVPIAAPLYFVSPGQINFQIPFEAAGSSIVITVSTAQGSGDPFKVNLDRMAPGIFSRTANGAGDAIVLDATFKLLTHPPDAGTTIILYATGLGGTTPAAKSGYGGSGAAPFNVVASGFDVYIGGTKATVAWAGLAPGFVGVYQVNVVPKGLAVGDIVIDCDCFSESNRVHMPEAPLNSGQGNETCFLGDSITADGGSTYYQSSGSYLLGTGWVDQLPILSMQSIYSADPTENFGVPGNTTTKMLARVSDVYAKPCRRVFVLGGTNDLGTLTPTQIAANLVAIYNALTVNGKSPIACTIPPKNSDVVAAQQTNAAIRSAANQHNVPLVDFYAALATSAGVYDPRYNDGDGTHPNPVGYRVMAQAAMASVGASFGPPTVWLPTTTTDAINLVANPLMGACASGVPEGWNGGYGNGRSPAFTNCVADSTTSGNWYQNIFAGASGDSGKYYVISAQTSIANTWHTGDKLVFVGRVQATGLESTGATLDFQLSGGSQSFGIYAYGADIANGVFAYTLTAPGPAAGLLVSWKFHYGATGGTVILKVAQVGVVNLTALGAQ